MRGLGTKPTIAKFFIRGITRAFRAEGATIEYYKSPKEEKIKIKAHTTEKALKLFRYVKNTDKPLN